VQSGPLLSKSDFDQDIIGNSDKKETWEKLYKFVDSKNIVTFNGLIEEYSNGNKFIIINKL